MAGIEKVGVKRIFTNIPVRKPHRQEFVRTHPDPDYRIDCKVLHLKNDNEVYFLHPDVFFICRHRCAACLSMVSCNAGRSAIFVDAQTAR